MPDIHDVQNDHFLTQLREVSKERGFFSKDSKALVVRSSGSGEAVVERRGSHFWVPNLHVGKEENLALRRKFYQAIRNVYGESSADALEKSLLGVYGNKGSNLSAKEVREAFAKAESIKNFTELPSAKFLKRLEEIAGDRGVLSKDSKAIVFENDAGGKATVRRRGSFFWVPDFNVGETENVFLREKFADAISFKYGGIIGSHLRDTLTGASQLTSNLSAAEVRQVFSQVRGLQSIYACPPERLLEGIENLAGVGDSEAEKLFVVQKDGRIDLTDNPKGVHSLPENRVLRSQVFKAISSKYGKVVAEYFEKFLTGVSNDRRSDPLNLGELRHLLTQARSVQLMYECPSERFFEDISRLAGVGDFEALDSQAAGLFAVQKDGNIGMADNPGRPLGRMERQALRGQFCEAVTSRYQGTIQIHVEKILYGHRPARRTDNLSVGEVRDILFAIRGWEAITNCPPEKLLEDFHRLAGVGDSTALDSPIKTGVSTGLFITQTDGNIGLADNPDRPLCWVECKALRGQFFAAITSEYGEGIAAYFKVTVLGPQNIFQSFSHADKLNDSEILAQIIPRKQGSENVSRQVPLSVKEIGDTLTAIPRLKSIHSFPPEQLFDDLSQLLKVGDSLALDSELGIDRPHMIFALQEDGRINLADDPQRPLSQYECQAIRLQVFSAITSRYGVTIANDIEYKLTGRWLYEDTSFPQRELRKDDLRDIFIAVRGLKAINDYPPEQLLSDLIYLAEIASSRPIDSPGIIGTSKGILAIQQEDNIGLADHLDKSAFDSTLYWTLKNKISEAVSSRFGQYSELEFWDILKNMPGFSRDKLPARKLHQMFASINPD